MEKLRKRLWLSLISLCVGSASVSAQPAKSGLPANTAVNFPSPAPAAEENYPNTITTNGPDGTRYKLVQIGDRLPKLFVNNKLVSAENLDRYGDLIGSLTLILRQRQKAAARQKGADETRQQDAIINDMVKDQLVKIPRDVLSFRLTANEMIVNGKAQSFPVFNRYMKKYIKNNDRVYQFNYSSK
jgi:hypothetical protein